MKILYLITKSEFGGAQTHVADLSRYFRSQGHEVVVMSRAGGWLEEACRRADVGFIDNKFFDNSYNPMVAYQAIKVIQKLVNEFKPDLVHCHSSVAGWLGRIAIRNKIKTIFTAHGWAFESGAPKVRRLIAWVAEKIASRYCSKIICVSAFTAAMAEKYHIASKEKIIVIHNGIESRIANHRLNDGKIRITFVGRLSRQKNPLQLLQAITCLPDNLVNTINVSIIGGGPDQNKISEFVAVHKLPVKIMGALSRDQVFAILEQSDIFVLTSRWEGFPYTILEAMGFGLPVIASAVGGVSEVVTEDTGMLVSPNDVSAVRNALAKLINDPELRLKLGDSAHRKIAEEYSLEKMIKSIEIIYKQVLC